MYKQGNITFISVTIGATRTVLY